MKIDKSIRDAYSEHLASNSDLKEEVDKVFALRDSHWHYECRLKSPESFALKVEAGLFEENLIIDDFLACLIVVRNFAEIQSAVEFVQAHFNLVNRRPEDDSKTTRNPKDFSFDDLRLYCTAKPVEYLPDHPRSKIIFEIQIKTFLQHAWAVATHDLTYKTDEVSWAKTRIAHQIRAMLEHAELSIEQVKELAGSALVAKQYADFEDLAKIIASLRTHWTQEALPKDLLRLARNTRSVIKIFGISLNELNEQLAEETAAGRGAKLENLSPYGTILQTILHKFPDNVAKKKRLDKKIPISKEVEVPTASEPLNKNVFKII